MHNVVRLIQFVFACSRLIKICFIIEVLDLDTRQVLIITCGKVPIHVFVISELFAAFHILMGVLLANVVLQIVVDSLVLKVSVEFEFGADFLLSGSRPQPEVQVLRLGGRVHIQGRIGLD